MRTPSRKITRTTKADQMLQESAARLARLSEEFAENARRLRELAEKLGPATDQE